MQTSLEDVQKALAGKHRLTIFDHEQDIGPQFEDVDVVIDHGGLVGTREMADVVAGRLKLWQVLGTGMDHFDRTYWREKGILIANCPGTTSGIGLADLAMMFILMLARMYPMAPRALREQLYNEPFGRDLDGLKLGIVGFGASGKLLSRRATSFGLHVSVIDVREIGSEEIKDYNLQQVGKPSDLDTMIANVDFLSLHVHLTEETRHLIDRRRLDLMNPTSCLINVARGELVDEAALTEALVGQRLGGAGLDVFAQEPVDLNSPLFDLENVVATYHCAGVTTGTSQRRAAVASENVDRVAQGMEPLHRVD